MMKESAVIENADGGHQGRPDQDGGNLSSSSSLKSQQDRNDDGDVHGQSAKKGNWSVMHLAWSRQVHHAHTQGERAHRNDQHHGSKQGNKESKQACGHATPFHTGNKLPPGQVGGQLPQSLPGWARLPSYELKIAAPTQRKHDTAIFVARQCWKKLFCVICCDDSGWRVQGRVKGRLRPQEHNLAYSVGLGLYPPVKRSKPCRYF